MRRFLLASASCLALAVSASAQVPPGFVGANYGGDPSAAAGAPNNGTGVTKFIPGMDRIYDTQQGGTSHITWWSTMNPSNGTINYAKLDTLLTAMAAAGRQTEYTMSGVPSWVNSVNDLSTAGQKTNLTTFISAMMSHIAGNGQCYGFFSDWNEFPPGIYWAGTDATMAAISSLMYPIIKAACPSTKVLSPSITAGVDNSSSPNPNSSFDHFYNVVAACVASCFDALNIHGYPMSPSMTTADAVRALAPELLVNSINNLIAIRTSLGLGSMDLYLDEGYAESDPASVTVDASTAAYASANAIQLLLASAMGIKSYANSFYGVGCGQQNACGQEYAANGPLKLTKFGLATRNLMAWLSGTTWSGTGLGRVNAVTNGISQAPNDASIVVGRIDGTGAGCPSPPAGTSGALPSHYTLSDGASVAGGLSHYLVGTGLTNGQPYMDFRECGTDTAGANSTLIRMDNFTSATATVGQQVVLSVGWGLAAGSASGISEFDNFINEYDSGHASTGEIMTQGQFLPVSGAVLPIQTRYIAQGGATAFAEPFVILKHYQNKPIDITVRIVAPRLDINATQWTGVITRPGGYQATVAWDASGAGTITAPASTTDWRDIFGGVHKAAAGDAVQLTNSPILIENTLPKVWFPAL